MTERYERALQTVQQRLHEEFAARLLGLLLTGSYAYGEMMETSDIDLYVIVDEPWRQRRNLVVEGVDVELFINPQQKLTREIAEGDSTTEMFARGRILFDPRGIVAELVAEAKAVYGRPRPRPQGDDLERLRYMATDTMKDAYDLLVADEDGYELAIFDALHWTLDAHYRLSQRRLPKAKYIARDLRETAPGVADAVAEVLDASRPRRERWERLATLTERVLAGVGGLLVESETTRADVKDADRLDSIVFDCARPAPLARFWCEVLDYEIAPYDDAEIERLRAMGVDDIEDDPGVLVLPRTTGPRLYFQKVWEGKTAKNRVHLDVKLRDRAHLDRLLELGATVVREWDAQDGYWLADPEGNDFCVIVPAN